MIKIASDLVLKVNNKQSPEWSDPAGKMADPEEREWKPEDAAGIVVEIAIDLVLKANNNLQDSLPAEEWESKWLGLDAATTIMIKIQLKLEVTWY